MLFEVHPNLFIGEDTDAMKLLHEWSGYSILHAFHEAEIMFVRRYAYYKPNTGIRAHINQNWKNYMEPPL